MPHIKGSVQLPGRRVLRDSLCLSSASRACSVRCSFRAIAYFSSEMTATAVCVWCVCVCVFLIRDDGHGSNLCGHGRCHRVSGSCPLSLEITAVLCSEGTARSTCSPCTLSLELYAGLLSSESASPCLPSESAPPCLASCVLARVLADDDGADLIRV